MIVDENNNSLQSYMDDVSNAQPLSREHEALLASRIQDGDIEARNELVAANLRFVIEVAGKYKNRGLAFPELISAGNQGILLAAERFDSDRGFKFITYAVWWIRQAISQALVDQSRTIRLPLNKVLLLRKIATARSRLEKEREGRVEIEEVADEIGVPVATVKETMVGEKSLYSLDEVLEEVSGSGIYEVLADDRQLSPDQRLVEGEDRAQIVQALAGLDERECRIVLLYFGLCGHPPQTLESIGVEMGLTRERIRQVKHRALRKLRESQLCEMVDYMP